MQTTIKTFEGVALAALDHQGSYEEIGRTFDRLTAWAGGLGLLDGNRRWFAIYEDDPDSVPVGRLRPQAGFEAGPEVPLMEGMRRIALAPGRMATTVHQGPYADLHRVYRSLYRDWLPGSGEEADDRPCFEEYLNDPRRTRPSDLLTEVFLPLKG
jgi:AraC family transcriptional regulator